MRPISRHMEILGTALQGLNSAETKLDQAASRISHASADTGVSGDSVDLATEMVNMTVAKEEYQANLKALQAGNEIAQHTIDILA